MNAKLLTWEEAVSWLREQPEQEALVKACFYDDPLIVAADRYFHSSEWKAISPYLPRIHGKALDIGAGRGIASYALAKQGFAVTALEPDPSQLVGAGAIASLAVEAGLDITVEQNWGERLPFVDETFDLVHARQVLHHAHDLKLLCTEASRVLKKGGLFIATREHVISTEADLVKFQNSHPLHRLYGGERAYQLSEYKQAICAAGIDLKQVLNPFASDINLYPETSTQLKQRIAKKLKLIPVKLLPDFLVKLLGNLDNAPGRLYSFIGYKHG
jgi:SAM-dependent methyltransferase